MLAIEDDPDHQFLIRSWLSRPTNPRFELEVSSRLETGLLRLSLSSFDVVILDLSLPDCEGFFAVRLLRQRAPGAGLVALTCCDDEQLIERAMDEGAHDFLIKQKLDGPSLVRALRGAVARQRELDVVSRKLAGSEASEARLQAELQAVVDGVERLGAGDFSVRLAQGAGDASEQAQRLAFDRAAEALSRRLDLNACFLSMAAHDMRSPLGTILLATDALENPVESPERHRWVELIQVAVRRQLRLVESVLDMYTLQAGQFELAPQWVDLNALMQQCATELRRQVSIRQQSLAVAPLPGDSQIWCDEGKVYRVLDNLLVNATKYGARGDTLELRAQAEATDTVRVEVVDHGPGLQLDEQFSIFERYRRGNHGNAPGSGSGLGLAICKDVVEAHGGRIWVESEPGHGCRFVFTLPRRPSAALGVPGF